MAAKPVVALDIDGTLGDYHGHFAWFAEQWMGRHMPDTAMMTPDVPFFKFLGMSKITYRQCKLAYRQGGLNRSMPVYPGASEMVNAFRKAGAEVWVCTTRPYLQHDNTDHDTRHWLRRNKITFDGLLYGPRKYKDILRQIPLARIVSVLDDLPEQCAAARELSLPIWIKDQPYNRSLEMPFNRVWSFENDPWLWDTVWRIKEWKKEHGS